MLFDLSVPFLLVLILASQSAALTISVPGPVVIGQVATSTWTRERNEPASFLAVLKPISGNALSSDVFMVRSGGQLTWEVTSQIPSDFISGSFVVQAFSRNNDRTPLATSNTFAIVEPGELGQNTQPTSADQTLTSTSVSPTLTPSLTSASNTVGGSSDETTSSFQTADTVAGQTTTAGDSTFSTGAAGSSSSTTVDQIVPSSPSAVADAAVSSSKTPSIVGGVIGALIGVALIALLTIIIVRKYRARQENVQFYEQDMVRPRQLDHSSTNLSAGHGYISSDGVATDALSPQTGYGYGYQQYPEQLPEYGYSNFDIVEKADYYRQPGMSFGNASNSPLPRGVMNMLSR